MPALFLTCPYNMEVNMLRNFCLVLVSMAVCGFSGCAGPRASVNVSEDGSPCIGGAKRYGNKSDTPFLYAVAASGDRPMSYSAKRLPSGLSLDKDTGIITGKVTRRGSYDVKVTASNARGTATEVLTFEIGDQLALTPPMGWMSWNQFGSKINEDLLKEIADAIVDSGMRDVGYQYIFIDDHWHGTRDADGIIHPDPNKFPSGMKALADYVHSKGLKLGIYSDAAAKTCGGEPGSYGYEENDAKTYAAWEMDYLKYDYCGAPRDQETAIKRYTAMSEALKATDRTIVFGVCEWGRREPWLWAARAGGQLWRTTWDIRDIWDHGKYTSGHAGIITILDKQIGLEKHAGPGHWNDPDMLVVGLNGKGRSSSANGANGCSEDEYRSNMSLWCLLAAPLYACCDVRQMDETTRSILTNVEAIAVNQDVLGKQGYRVAKDGDLEVWAKPLSGGDWALGLLNRGTEEAAIEARWSDIGVDGKYTVRDLWQHKDMGPFDEAVTLDVAGHETKLLRLSSR